MIPTGLYFRKSTLLQAQWLSSRDQEVVRLHMTPLMLTWIQRAGMTSRTLAGKQPVNEANAVVATEETSHILVRNILIAQTKSEVTMNSDSLTLIQEILQALDKQELARTEPIQKKEILSKIQSVFIKGNPRAWWASLISKPKIQTYNDNTGYLHLCELAPNQEEDVWLIADEDNEEKFLFSLPLNCIPSVLDDCRYFEYYIVNKQLKWMIAENDHGDLIFCNAPEL